MGAITLRKVPEALHNDLKRITVGSGNTLENLIIEILTKSKEIKNERTKKS